MSDEDGSFIEIKFKKDSFSIKRDLWGSIPIYYNENQQIISNSLKNILNIIKKSKPNIPAIAEFICSAYNTGSRTIYNEIKFLLPDKILNFNFEKKNLNLLIVSWIFMCQKMLTKWFI